MVSRRPRHPKSVIVKKWIAFFGLEYSKKNAGHKKKKHFVGCKWQPIFHYSTYFDVSTITRYHPCFKPPSLVSSIHAKRRRWRLLPESLDVLQLLSSGPWVTAESASSLLHQRPRLRVTGRWATDGWFKMGWFRINRSPNQHLSHLIWKCHTMSYHCKNLSKKREMRNPHHTWCTTILPNRDMRLYHRDRWSDDNLRFQWDAW